MSKSVLTWYVGMYMDATTWIERIIGHFIVFLIATSAYFMSEEMVGLGRWALKNIHRKIWIQ